MEDLPINNKKLKSALSQALLENVRNEVAVIITRGIKDNILFCR